MIRGLSTLSALTQSANKVWQSVGCEKSCWIDQTQIKVPCIHDY